MIPVRLETADGHLVSEQAIPPFDPVPEVVVWGIRFFLQHGEYTDAYGYDGLVYRESFYYPITGREYPTMMELRQAERGKTP